MASFTLVDRMMLLSPHV